MRPIYLCLLFLMLFLGNYSCDRENPLSDTPVIDFLSLSKDTIVQGRVQNDSLKIKISFTDGDGDIGSDENQPNIYLVDSRDNFPKQFSAPAIPISGAANGVTGEITILVTTLFNVCCIFSNGQDPCTQSETTPSNEFYYTIYIEDRAGNRSNSIETEMITLLCL